MLFSWDLLLTGFADALTWTNLLWALVGCLVGTLIGVLPGIGPSAGIAILLPMTTMIPPTSGIIMMAAIYYGAMYGGSTTAIVVNIPGEASSVPTCIDGYEMAKQGRAGAALGISAISSFVAGTLGLVGLTFFAPLLANFALAFGPPEYFALMFMGLSLVISLSGRALLKGMIATSIGLLSSLIGQNPLTGAARLTFGVVDLMAGLNFISIIIGLFAVSEVMINVEQAAAHIYGTKFHGWMPTWAEIRQCAGTMLRSSGIGFFLGLLPGCAPAVTTFIAYDVEKRVSKTPERFGKGAIEGVAAPEGANNATSSAGFVPLFAFGLPTGPALAVLMGGLMMYGLQPGPMLFQTNPKFVWAVIASMYIGNVMLLVLNLPLVGFWARIALIPFPVLGTPHHPLLRDRGVQHPVHALRRLGRAPVRGGRLRDAEAALSDRSAGARHRPRADAGDVPAAVAADLPGLLAHLLQPAHRRLLHGPGPRLHRKGDLAPAPFPRPRNRHRRRGRVTAAWRKDSICSRPTGSPTSWTGATGSPTSRIRIS